MTDTKSLEVTKLRVEGLPSHAAIVDGLDLDLRAGEIVGVVGESGSGKTTLALALLNYLKTGTDLGGGQISVDGTDLATLSVSAVRRLRGTTVAYIPQSPASALNPALRIRTQLRECLTTPGSGRDERIQQVLREVAMPDDTAFLRRYPHQLSGGQQQRIVIAMAFLSRPKLIVLDEPTTGLDVTTQRQVLATVRELCTTYGVAAVYISHDMAVVADLAQRIAVMYSGRLVEVAPTPRLLTGPQHPYTVGLLTAAPDPDGRRSTQSVPGVAPSPLDRPPGCAFSPRCPIVTDACEASPPPATEVEPGHSVRCLRAGEQRLQIHTRDTAAPTEPGQTRLQVEGLRAWYGKTQVLDEIELSLHAGRCVALLGESGSGKTTLSRCVAGLHSQYAGRVLLDGSELPRSVRRRSREQRRRVQYIFQNPYEALNPRRTVHQLIAAPMRQLLGKVSDADLRIRTALERVSLRPEFAARFPEQLSGGERQRVAIARALVVEPDVLVCDEITSALDVSVQASITELLQRLQRELELTLLFVTHDIALVRSVAERVAVLSEGVLVETGPVESVFESPGHDYTRTLLADTPRFELATAPSTAPYESAP
jgi:peptide/nickel transport system ATP-binding protein